MSESAIEKSTQYSFFPINHQKLNEFYQIQKNLFWIVNDIDFSGDRADWDKLDDNTKHFLKFVLAFFAQFDGIVIENLNVNFQNEVGHIKEARAAYCFQAAMEVIHNETYSVMIETFIRDTEEKNKMFDAIAHYPAIKKIADWAVMEMSQAKPLIDRIIAFSCIEGILFSSAFAAIYWIKRKKVLVGLTKANEYIARDEGLHVKQACEVCRVLCHDLKSHTMPPQEKVNEIISNFMMLTEEFVRDALNVSLIGMSFDSMMSYCKTVADSLLEMLGYQKLYNVENKLTFMISIGLMNKTNFFEEKVSEYGKNEDGDFTFTTDELF